MWFALALACAVLIFILSVAIAQSISQYDHRRLCLLAVLSVPLAGVFVFSIVQLLTHPLPPTSDHATGFPAGWHCANASQRAPVCFKDD
jgi:hypothetical protein